jgi:hypothetical protein
MKKMTFTVGEKDFELNDQMSEAEKIHIYDEAMKGHPRNKKNYKVIDVVTEVKRILVKDQKVKEKIKKLKREIYVMDQEIVALEHLIAKRDQLVGELKKLEEDKCLIDDRQLAEYEGKKALGEGLLNLP